MVRPHPVDSTSQSTQSSILEQPKSVNPSSIPIHQRQKKRCLKRSLGLTSVVRGRAIGTPPQRIVLEVVVADGVLERVKVRHFDVLPCKQVRARAIFDGVKVAELGHCTKMMGTVGFKNSQYFRPLRRRNVMDRLVGSSHPSRTPDPDFQKLSKKVTTIDGCKNSSKIPQLAACALDLGVAGSRSRNQRSESRNLRNSSSLLEHRGPQIDTQKKVTKGLPCLTRRVIVKRKLFLPIQLCTGMRTLFAVNQARNPSLTRRELEYKLVMRACFQNRADTWAHSEPPVRSGHLRQRTRAWTTIYGRRRNDRQTHVPLMVTFVCPKSCVLKAVCCQNQKPGANKTESPPKSIRALHPTPH